MEPLYTQNFEITDHYVDCFGRLTTASIPLMIQEVAGTHGTALSVDYDPRPAHAHHQGGLSPERGGL